MFCNHFPVSAVLFSNLPVLREQRIVIVGSHIWSQLIIIIRAVHKTEICAALKHIDIDIAKLKHPVEVFYALLKISPHMAAVAPMVKPSDPELGAHQRSAIGIARKQVKALVRLRAEIPGWQRP